MARKKISLREFQQGVSAKLQALSETAPVSSRLGLQVGSQSWLVDLADISEVVPVPPLTAVPLTSPWFIGVANIRGNLYSIADFSAFLGGEPAPLNMDSRLLLVNQKFSVNSGLVVTRILGLRNPEQFQRNEGAKNPEPWIGAEYTDNSGQQWMELNIRELVHHPDFLRVGL